MRVLFICFVFILVRMGNAQKNSLYVEALGNGGVASLNYERQLSNNPIFLFRIGLGVVEDNLTKPTRLLSIPSSIHYLIDLKKGNYLDLSVGASWYDAAKEGPDGGVFHLFTGIGFRRNFAKSWFFRVHFSPYIRSLTQSVVVEPMSSAMEYGGFSSFFNFYSPEFYRYAHEDAWVGFSIGKRF